MNRHQRLFEEYVVELGKARASANAWWENTLRREVKTGLTPEEAEARVRQRWPAGPTSHPWVIAVVRKYFLLCEEINRSLPPADSEVLEADVDEADESEWGSSKGEEASPEPDAAEDWGSEYPMEPPVLLFEMLSGRHESLAEFMAFYIYASIGEKDGVAV